MNTQMLKPQSQQDQGTGGGLHSAGGHHEQDEHHEKKSVIKKVKAKAKKIKDTIGSKIHSGHDHEHDHDRELDQDMDEGDDFDDELEQDPDVHGAPMYESSAVMMGSEKLNPGQTHLNVVDKGHTGPAGIEFGEKEVPGPKRTDFDVKSNSGQTKADLHDKAYTEQSRNNLGMSKTGEASTGLGMHTGEAKTGLGMHTGEAKTGLGMHTGEAKTGLGMHKPLESDPNAPFSFDTTGNYQSKVTDPTGAGAKEADMEPMIRSFGKMDVTNEPGEKPAESHEQFSPDSTPNRNPSYTERITSGTSAIVGSATSSITGTAAAAKNAVASKLGYGGTDNSNIATQDTRSTHNEGTHTGDQTTARNPSYTEKVTSGASGIAGSAASTVTGTAVAAKNAVASKLGYGGNDNSNIATQDTHMTRNEGAHTGDQTKSYTATVGDYGRQVTSTVYGTVAGVGSAVKSKIQGTGTNTSTGADSGTGTGPGGVGSVTEQDKGVSMKDYIVQKLSPGDEDKALSEVITGVVHKKKDEFPETVAQNMDRVTDSPEVARSLGTGEHEYRKDGDQQGYGNDGSSIGGGVGSPSGKGMVGRVKGVVSSWFGKGAGDQIYADEQRSPGGVVGGSTGRKDESHETSSTGVVH